MDVGLALPQYDYAAPGGQLSWPAVVEWAQRAEQLGFTSLWLADHLFLSIEKYGGPRGEHFGYEPLTGLAALARKTTAAQLGTLVLCSQLRPPAVLAKNLVALDQLSHCRVVVGMGAGWFEPEYLAAGIPFGSPRVRLEQLEEAATIVKQMTTTGDPYSFSGKHYRVERARLNIGSRGLPVWIGGRGDKLLGVVARVADGWNTVWSWSIEDYRARLEVLQRACDAVGRDPQTIHLSVGLFTLVGETERDLQQRFEQLALLTPRGVLPPSLAEWRTGKLVGTVEEVREQLAAWAALGVSTMIIGLGALPFSGTTVDDLDIVAAAVV